MRRTIRNRRKTRTNNISIKTSQNLENPQCILCNTIMPIHQKWNLWQQLPKTTSRITRRRKSIQSRFHLETSKKRKGISILHQMERISDYRSKNESAFSENGDMLEQYKLQNQLWITIHNDMPSMQLSQSTPNLWTKTSRIWLDNKEVKQTISSLEEELEGMFAKYEYMDKPIKMQQWNILEIYQKLWIYNTTTCLHPLSPPSPK